METVERRFQIMKVLCIRRHETMADLATEFGVSVRTIQRDIDRISCMMPIYIKSGRYEGGVYVVDGYYMDRMYMTKDEITLLNKIRNIIISDYKCFLSAEEICLFDGILSKYTMPSVS